MKKLISLPSNLVQSVYQVFHLDRKEWFCSSDPDDRQLGSGGGTAWLLNACRLSEAPALPMADWLKKEKRIILHAGGQSRRLPSYATSGKVFTPVPVFRWERGQRLNQNLLSLQIPLYEKIMAKAPDSLRTLIASGDVYIRTNEELQSVPKADVVCYGLWVDASLAKNHGVFVSNRNNPDELDFMLQKPSIEQLGDLNRTHFFLMDIGIWLLSDRAMALLMQRSGIDDGFVKYDLYAEFGLALGKYPRIKDEEVNRLTVAIRNLPGGEFYHYGTSRELISSTLAIQNRVRDQRAIMHRKVKPHPAMFVQNALVDVRLTAENAELWIENSQIGKNWKLNGKHILTGVPENNWTLDVPSGACIDITPYGSTAYAVRPYGFEDAFRGVSNDKRTTFLGKSVEDWFRERNLPEIFFDDIQDAALFPLLEKVDEIGIVLRWMLNEPDCEVGARLWLQAEKVSANQILMNADMKRLIAQREMFCARNWPALAANHEKSVFYQLDLKDAAGAFVRHQLDLPAPLPVDVDLMKRIHDNMFRAEVLHLRNEDFSFFEEQAFKLLREGLAAFLKNKKQSPHLDVYRDQIVWSRSPVRIDLAGGWTDTPPYCLYVGGNVVNLAIELNGQPPLQVYVKPSKEPIIILRSIDMGAMDVISTWGELRDFNRVGSPFSIPKAALALAGFLPEFAEEQHKSLEEHLKVFGAGIELTLLSAIPAGSGLGTSSILAATVLGALSDFCGLKWDKNEIGKRTLILEQLLTTGGGWQDQYGGLLHGLKLLQTTEGFDQNPSVRWLPEYLFTNVEYASCHLLYYTGITRTAKNILAEIVRGMFLNSSQHLGLLVDMKAHALDMFDTIQRGDFQSYGQLIKRTWELNKSLDSGTNPLVIEQLIERIEDYALGCKLPGAGGGGYLYIVAKDPDSALKIKQLLNDFGQTPNARFVEMSLSQTGLQVSRS
ncbi:MAG: bifunctional fucokinase/fucose-1-phosphate guanylyltransferase [Massilibacteroides sp.]|nr:bifunctional fucokinase/fucose-1-phosphate guanylyltransferase [Massilibacteroides sp.]MDD3063377.1 bifunctional fucokinase/fucose-1-phosphate guanylyltransferase [Massilibacteroides sp.]MDD4114130.1 bifunctional fucokinase/fucose-1-phosphate guanylyltransferase [Massilibacteroides sp.]MDD4659105.1 bifunctional fucokinase/fucose-1-phosphate guanylyltransferase [Massilibacteroides sp.]